MAALISCEKENIEPNYTGQRRGYGTYIGESPVKSEEGNPLGFDQVKGEGGSEVF